MKHNNVNSHQSIRDAIQKIALYGVQNNKRGSINGTEKISGYVAKIHTEGDLAGTVDVQEFVDAGPDSENGYHVGVFLTAIQNNISGLLVIPKLYSEVIITKDVGSQVEYVIMTSHVDVLQLVSHDNAKIGVVELEEYDPDDPESPDIDELQPTDSSATTEYTKESASTYVKNSEHTVKIEAVPDRIYMDSDNASTSMEINPEHALLQHDSSSVTLDDNQVAVIHGKKMVVKDDAVYLGDTSNVDDGVLGVELANILSEMLGYIGQIMTTTQLGPQPPVNIASFISLKAKIEAFKASHSGFLTSKVKLQK